MNSGKWDTLVAQPVQASGYTVNGDTVTEIARNAASNLELMVSEGRIATPSGTHIADSIGELAEAMLHLEWISVSPASIYWDLIKIGNKTRAWEKLAETVKLLN